MTSNLVEHVSSFRREELHVPRKMGSEAIILPKAFFKSTTQMATTQDETRGVFITNPDVVGRSTVHRVVFMEVLGTGTSTSVYPVEARMKAAEELLRMHPSFRSIDFHVHTTGTGDSFHDRFSDGDFRTIARNLSQAPGYKHVLLTPTHVLTFGTSKPTFHLDNSNNPQVMQEYQRLKAEFEAILQRR